MEDERGQKVVGMKLTLQCPLLHPLLTPLEHRHRRPLTDLLDMVSHNNKEESDQAEGACQTTNQQLDNSVQVQNTECFIL